MTNGLFFRNKHRGLVALLYYSGVREYEALRAIKEQFILDSDRRVIMFEVGKRLKHGRQTPPLLIPADAPWARYIWLSIVHTKPGERVWPYCNKTGYNICRRVFKYPHYFRLSRITNFFNDGRTVTELKNWTGLTLTALDFYVGAANIQKMGESLNPNRKEKKAT
jgi:hypothetical protein